MSYLRFLTGVALVSFLSLGSIGCQQIDSEKKSSTASAKTTEQLLVGVWEAREEQENLPIGSSIEFTADGTAILRLSRAEGTKGDTAIVQKGVYELVKENRIKFVWGKDPPDVRVVISLTEQQLVIGRDDHSKKVTLVASSSVGKMKEIEANAGRRSRIVKFLTEETTANDVKAGRLTKVFPERKEKLPHSVTEVMFPDSPLTSQKPFGFGPGNYAYYHFSYSTVAPNGKPSSHGAALICSDESLTKRALTDLKYLGAVRLSCAGVVETSELSYDRKMRAFNVSTKRDLRGVIEALVSE